MDSASEFATNPPFLVFPVITRKSITEEPKEG